MKRILLSFIFTVLTFFGVLHAQTSLNGVSFKVYDKPDTNSTQIKITEGQCDWKMVNTVRPHKHLFQYLFREFDDTVDYEISAYYGLVQSTCGDIGYVHSSQLDFPDQGAFKLSRKYLTHSLVLEKLPPQSGCSEFSYIYGSFRTPQGKQINIPLNTYWGFYATNEDCKSIINEYLYGCSFEFTYNIQRYYSWDFDNDWTYEINVTKSIVTQSPEMTVSGINVNIRKGPGKNFEVIGKLNPNDSFVLMELAHEEALIDNYDGSWMKINNGQIEGWIFSKFITKK